MLNAKLASIFLESDPVSMLANAMPAAIVAAALGPMPGDAAMMYPPAPGPLSQSVLVQAAMLVAQLAEHRATLVIWLQLQGLFNGPGGGSLRSS
jgi:hypothetical protein